MKALVVGANGQDGSYLTEFLLGKGYDVWGTVRRHSVPESQTQRLNHIFHLQRFNFVYADLLDTSSLISTLQRVMPDEIYNLAAQSHVKISFDNPIYTCNVVGLGVLNLLEAVRLICPKAKFYQASSSEMFGNNVDADGFQRETTPMSPVSPYGCAKLFSHSLIKNYRHSYGMFLCSGILFNHESPRRGINFVTNKVAKAAVEIYRGKAETLELGNLNASRDWGHSSDYVKAMWMMLQNNKPEDFVCATGVSHTVKELCEYTFGYLGMDYKNYVVSEDKYLRPEELHFLKGDSSKLRTSLGWQPTYTFETMLAEMVEYWKGQIK